MKTYHSQPFRNIVSNFNPLSCNDLRIMHESINIEFSAATNYLYKRTNYT